MKSEYLRHLATLNLSGLCFRVLMLLLAQNYTQSAISSLLNIDRQTINKTFNKLKEYGLIEVARKEGRNEFYKAVTDPKKLKTNIPGQIKLNSL